MAVKIMRFNLLNVIFVLKKLLIVIVNHVGQWMECIELLIDHHCHIMGEGGLLFFRSTHELVIFYDNLEFTVYWLIEKKKCLFYSDFHYTQLFKHFMAYFWRVVITKLVMGVFSTERVHKQHWEIWPSKLSHKYGWLVMPRKVLCSLFVGWRTDPNDSTADKV